LPKEVTRRQAQCQVPSPERKSSKPNHFERAKAPADRPVGEFEAKRNRIDLGDGEADGDGFGAIITRIRGCGLEGDAGSAGIDAIGPRDLRGRSQVIAAVIRIRMLHCSTSPQVRADFQATVCRPGKPVAWNIRADWAKWNSATSDAD